MTKITQLPPISGLSAEDLLVVVDDPSGFASTKSATLQGVLDFVGSGLGVASVSSGGTGATTAAGARSNLGVAYGSVEGTVCEGNDPRLGDSRVPIDGSVTSAKIAANQIVQFGGIIVENGPGLGKMVNLRDTGFTMTDSGGLLGTYYFSISPYGVVGRGTWQGDAVGVAYGGTGSTVASEARSSLGIPHTMGTGGTSVVAWQSGNNVASGDWSTVSGGRGNTASGLGGVVSGGNANTSSASYGSVLGGNTNMAGAIYAVVGGGSNNTAGSAFSAVAGGSANFAGGNYSFVGGGRDNRSSAAYSSVSAGRGNTASGEYGVVAGGNNNTAHGAGSSVLGGTGNASVHPNSHVLGSNITTDLPNTTFVEGLKTRGPINEGLVVVGDTGTSKTLDLSGGTFHTCNLTGDCTFTMPELAPGRSFTLVVTQTGSFTAAFSGVRWMSGVSPVASTGAGKVDIFSFVSDGSYWYGTAAQGFV